MSGEGKFPMAKILTVVAVLVSFVPALGNVVCEESNQWLMRHSDVVFVGVATDVAPIKAEFHQLVAFSPSEVWKGGTRGNYIAVIVEEGQIAKDKEYLVFATDGGCSMYLDTKLPAGHKRKKQLEKKYDPVWRAPKK